MVVKRCFVSLLLESVKAIASILIFDVVRLQDLRATVVKSPPEDIEVVLKEYTLALLTPEQTEGECRVGQFEQTERAIELAEFIAAEMSLEEGRWGWSIEVRDSRGSKLCRVPVESVSRSAPNESALEESLSS